MRTAEEWVRCGLEESPWALRRLVRVVHAHVLRFRLGPHSSPDHVLGSSVLTSEPDVVQLEAISPIGRGVIVGRRPDATSTTLTTFTFMTRPRTIRAIWTVLRPVHRRVAPYLLQRAAGLAQTSTVPPLASRRRPRGS